MQQTHVKYGLVTTLVIIIVGVVLHVTGLNYSLKYGWAKQAPYLILLIGVVFNSIAFSNKNNNNVVFGQIFASNFRVLAVVVLVIFFWSLISMYFIFPDTKEKVLNYLAETWRQDNITESAIENRLKPVKDNFLAFSLAIPTFITLFFGAVFAVIGAAIAKKKPKAN